MHVKVVYGCPCSGKSTYVINHAGENDIIYDYDAMLQATTTRKKQLVARHAAHFAVLNLRKSLVDNAKNEKAINCIWLLCNWPTDTVREILDGLDTEDIFIEATEDECYARLEADDTRPDKAEWKMLIRDWFIEHGKHDDSKQTKEGRDFMSKHTKFWNFIKNDAGERVLRLEGPIDSENFWGDEITPKIFREELEADIGDITVWINSPGGSVFAAAEIYTMLCDYSNNKKGKVTVKIDAIAASAASVVAMAGERVLMSPVSMLMIHDPMTIAMGNAEDMEKAITTLNEIKESIINAYQKKTGLSRNKISKLMSDETWLNAKKAVELGFADEILFADSNGNNTKSSDGDDDADTADHSPDAASEEGISLEGGDGQSVASKAKDAKNTFWVSEWQPYSTRAMGQAILNRLIPAVRDDAVANEANSETADTEAVLESSLTATAEEAPQEVQTQEEEAPSAAEANTVSDTSDNVSTDEPDAVIDTVTDDMTNAEEGQTEETQPEPTEPTVSSDNVQDNVVDNVETGNEQELGAEDSEPVTVIVTDDVATNNLPDDLKTPEVSTEPKTVDEAKPKELTIGLDGKAKDGSMPYALLEKQLQLLR